MPEPITTDGYTPYNLASRYITSEIHKLIGDPDERHISTSFAERNNLNVRMMMRRMTRLTNAFSKKVENHAQQHAINFAYYNFWRIHKTLCCTPPMAAGITASPWDVSDLVYITTQHEIMSKWDLRTILPPHPHVA